MISYEFVSHLVHESVISLVYMLDLESINLFPIFSFLNYFYLINFIFICLCLPKFHFCDDAGLVR